MKANFLFILAVYLTPFVHSSAQETQSVYNCIEFDKKKVQNRLLRKSRWSKLKFISRDEETFFNGIHLRERYPGALSHDLTSDNFWVRVVPDLPNESSDGVFELNVRNLWN